jgi:hypothetical protein
MTMMNIHGSLLLLVLSRLHAITPNKKVCHILVFEYTFFQSIFMGTVAQNLIQDILRYQVLDLNSEYAIQVLDKNHTGRYQYSK